MYDAKENGENILLHHISRWKEKGKILFVKLGFSYFLVFFFPSTENSIGLHNNHIVNYCIYCGKTGKNYASWEKPFQFRCSTTPILPGKHSIATSSEQSITKEATYSLSQFSSRSSRYRQPHHSPRHLSCLLWGCYITYTWRCHTPYNHWVLSVL